MFPSHRRVRILCPMQRGLNFERDRKMRVKIDVSLPQINQSDPHSFLLSTARNNTRSLTRKKIKFYGTRGIACINLSYDPACDRNCGATGSVRKPVKVRGAWKNLATLPEKAFLGHYAAIITLISAESRVSKTISILMGGSRVNPFIGVGQIRIPLSLSLPISLFPRRAVERGSGTVAVR